MADPCPNEKLLVYIKTDNDKKFDDLKTLVEGLDSKVDLLFQFKWQIVGWSAGVSAMVGGIIVIVGFILKN